MQFKVFTIPIIGGEQINEEMNQFLRSQKILEVEKQLIVVGNNAYWSYNITYLDGQEKSDRPKVDYKEILDAPTFRRFSHMREIRKRLAEEEGLPAYSVFTNEELATMAKMETLTEVTLKSIKGVGKKKIEKYGQYFLDKEEEDEKSE